MEVEPAELPPLRAEPEQIPLEILYEDQDVVAVNKPAGMVVHAGAGCRSGTLVNALLARFESLSGVGGELRPGIVHRLDRYTSGVILVARHDAAHRHLAEQFARRVVEKVYLALVHGAVKQERGKIEKPISRDPVRRVRMTARLGRGRSALTEYRVLRRYRDFTLLEVRIGTGPHSPDSCPPGGDGAPGGWGPPVRSAGEGRRAASRSAASSCMPTGSASRALAAEKPSRVEAPLPAELEAWMEGLL